jgi:hypothetical protein
MMIQHPRAFLTIFAATIGLGCGDGAPIPGVDGAIGGGEGGQICPRCVRSSARPADAALPPAATPCQRSGRLSPIGAAAARDIGFGSVLDVLERTFESPFTWQARNTGSGGPATGYSPTTTLMGRTRISAIEHRVPSMAGCADSVSVTLEVSLSTGDGALAVEGHLRSFAERGATAPMVWGSIDLADAHGTLRLSPQPWPKALSGYFSLTARFWPDLVRGQALVSVDEAGMEGSDTPTYSYMPLEGRWALGDCYVMERPVTATEPHATPDGRTADQVHLDLQRLLDASPRIGHWDGGGAEVAVTAQLGGPTSVCVKESFGPLDPWYLTYRTELRMTSTDGRLQLQRNAEARAQFDPMNALSSAMVEVYEQTPVAAKDFATTTGISGVDLGRMRAAFWHTEIYLAEGGIVAPRGDLTVEGIGLDGSTAGPIASFKWR